MKNVKTLSAIAAMILMGTTILTAYEEGSDIASYGNVSEEEIAKIEAQMLENEQKAEMAGTTTALPSDGEAVLGDLGNIQPNGTEIVGQTYYGSEAGANNTALNVAFFGNSAGKENTTGAFNTMMGQAAGILNTTGENNTFIGFASGNLNATGSGNTFMGSLSGLSNYASNNTFIGFQSGKRNQSGTPNTFLGYQSGYNNWGG